MSSIGKDLKKSYRIVIDDLDSVSNYQANQILTEAWELVHTWPEIQVLATSRPGVSANLDELIKIEPWTILRGIDLVRLVVGKDLPWRFWEPETTELLTRPLTALALAARLNSGMDANVSKLKVLSDLARTIIEQRRPERVTPQIWGYLARLASRILDSQGGVDDRSFGDESEVWQLTDTGLIINDYGVLKFTLPVFEQHFGSQAIKSNIAQLEAVASAASFPRWRYAIAFAVSTSEPYLAEELMTRLAQTNPAAFSWVLSELKSNDRRMSDWRNASNEVIELVIGKRSATGNISGSSTSILAGNWLRQALQAILDGLGPISNELANCQNGKLVQWGTLAGGGRLTIAESSEVCPPPEVVQLKATFFETNWRTEWKRWQQFKFPTTDLGRWTWAREYLRRPLLEKFENRTLPVLPGSQLAKERLWFLAHLIVENGYRRSTNTISLTLLRRHVAEMMENVRGSVNSRWHKSGYTIDSADVRWVDMQLQLQTADALERPWPAPDQPNAIKKWAWQGYSPELSNTILTGVLREAVTGYRELVELNFPSFGHALGLYSILPIHIDGIIARFADDDLDIHSGLLFAIKRDPEARSDMPPRVELDLLTDHNLDQRWQFSQSHTVDRPLAFHPETLEDSSLPLHLSRPASNFAYEWLARDLKAVGWMTKDVRYYD